MFHFENRVAIQEVNNTLKKRRIQTQQAQQASLQEAQQAQAAQQAQQSQAHQQEPAGMNIYAMAFASRRLLKRSKRRRRSIVTCWTYTNNTRIYMHSDCRIMCRSGESVVIPVTEEAEAMVVLQDAP